MSRATRLLVELVEAIESGQVVRPGRVWPAPRDAWGRGLEVALARRDEGKLDVPLKDHAYLFEIVSSFANRQEAAAEARVEDERRHHRPVPTGGDAGPRRAGDVAGNLEAMWQAIGRKPPAAEIGGDDD